MAWANWQQPHANFRLITGHASGRIPAWTERAPELKCAVGVQNQSVQGRPPRRRREIRGRFDGVANVIQGPAQNRGTGLKMKCHFRFGGVRMSTPG